MPLEWLGSAIGGVANAITSIFTGKANRKHQARENQKDREFNAEQAQISRDWQEEQYVKYESPAAQMQQMKSAGVNPLQGVSSQSVGSGSTASASSSSLPQAQAPDFSFLGELNLMDKQIKGLKLDNEIKVQQDKKLEEETKSLQLDNKKKAIEANDWESYWELTKEQLFRSNKKLAKDTEYVEELKKKAHEEFRLARVNANNAEAVETAGYNPQLSEAQLKSIDAEIASATKDYQIEQHKTTSEQAKRALDLFNKKFDDEVDLLKSQRAAAELANMFGEREFNLTNYIQLFYDIFGFDPRLLPTYGQGYIIQDLLKSITVKDDNYIISKENFAIIEENVKSILNDYITKDVHIVQSASSNIGFGPFSFGAAFSQ